MSVLNITNDGLFNVLIVLTRALILLGPRTREELLNACGAKVTTVDPKQLSQTLARWTDLGLFAVEDGLVKLSESHRDQLGKKADVGETRLPKTLRAITLSPVNNARFWESEENKSADLTRGLSWILAQDVYSIDTSSHQKIAALENSQVADFDKRIFQNDTRWNGFRSWMVYLGFARGGSQVVIDPTDAIRDVLNDIFGRDKTLLAQIFLDRAAKAIPVLDGGAYRLKIEDVLKGSIWTRPQGGFLSTSFSRAIQRLAREGLIGIEHKSDAEGGITLVGANQRPWRHMTQISLHPAKKGN